MACDLTTGIAKQCKEQLGGNSSIYLFNFIEDPFTIVGGAATAINIGLTAVYEYKIEGDGNTLVQSLVSDRATGTAVNTQTLTALIYKQDATKAAELNVVAKGFPMAVVKDRNGEYHAIGIVDGIDFTIEGATGGAKTDFNGYTLTGVSTTGAMAPILDSATTTAFLALVV